MKIRQVAASLVEGDPGTQERSDQAERRAQLYLQKFAAILTNLDHNFPRDLQQDSDWLSTSLLQLSDSTGVTQRI